MRGRPIRIAARAAVCAAVAPLLGCPQIVFGIPASFRSPPRLAGPEPDADASAFSPVTLDLETAGYRLHYRLRVDGRYLEPTLGACRGFGLVRVARLSDSGARSFCQKDSVRFFLATGVAHEISLVIGSEHKVAQRRKLEPGRNLLWIMPIHTDTIAFSLTPEPKQAYRIRAEEKIPRLREALGENAPPETSRNLEAYEPVFASGVEVGILTLRVVRDSDGETVRRVFAPLYSGRMRCEFASCDPY